MTYIPDLTLCTYARASYGPTLAIGWLDGSKRYTQGKAPLALLLKMRDWALNPQKSVINWTRGWHDANLKKVQNPVNAAYPQDIFSTEGTHKLNNGEFHVHYNGKFYASPAMIFHYVLDYDYLPPQEYIDAVLHGELLTNANIDRFAQNVEEELTPEAIQGMFELANQELETGNSQDALSTVNELLASLPNLPILYALRGAAYYKLGELKKAKADLDLILFIFQSESGQNYAHVLSYLGKIARDQGDLLQAKNYFKRALLVYPEDQEVKKLLDSLS